MLIYKITIQLFLSNVGQSSKESNTQVYHKRLKYSKSAFITDYNSLLSKHTIIWTVVILERPHSIWITDQGMLQQFLWVKCKV